MKIALIALTKGGTKTALHIKEQIDCDVFVKHMESTNDSVTIFTEKLAELVAKKIHDYDAFILIMAAGIAFRTFAGYVEAKDKDPALVVVDEKGEFAISLLSGHLGGANELTRKIAQGIGATPVITTATDVNQKIAFDNLAKENGFVIENLRMIQHISSALVNDKKVALYTSYKIMGNLPEYITNYEEMPQEEVVVISNKKIILSQNHVLYLRPKNLVLGVGCRKNTPYTSIKEAFESFMKDSGYSPLSLKAMSSIDLKKDEEALIALSNELEIPFYTYSSEELKNIPAEGGTSDFVKLITGTESVSQSAALYCSNHGKTVVKKTIVNGITFSLAEEETTIQI